MTSTNCYSGTKTETKSISVNIKAPVPPPTPTGDSTCGPGTVTLSASGSSGSYRWYDNNGSLISGNASSSLTINNLTSTKVYKVSSYLNGCESAKVNVTATFKTIPQPPSGSGNSRCGPGEMVLTASGSPSSQYRWYAPNGNIVAGATTSTLTISTMNQTSTYEVSAYVNGCESNRVAVTGTINSVPTAPTPINKARCGSGNITIFASGFNEGEYRWYAPNGSLIPGATSASLAITNLSSTATYKVSGLVGCESAKTNVTATINPAVGQPNVVGGENCGPGTVTLTASGSSSNQYRWYFTDGSPISGNTSNTLTTAVLSETTTYKVSIYEGPDCEGPTRNVTATILQIPSAPVVNNDDSCGQGDVAFVASGSPSGSYKWYDPNGTLIVGNNTNTLTIADLSITATYEVSSIVGGCEGPRSAAVGTITTPKLWYDDSDNDGLGDPNMPSSYLCAAPAGYVANSSDLCPNIQSATNDCNVPIVNDPKDQNYIYTRNYQVPWSANAPGLKFLEDDSYIQDITYFDGHGRPRQKTAIRQAPNDKKDIVSHMAYDDYGRKEKEWLPFHDPTGAIGEYRTGDMEDSIQQYYKANFSEDFNGILTEDTNPYIQIGFEDSPLNRVLKQAKPGEDWKLDQIGDDHSVEMEYLSNVSDEVRQFNVTLAYADKTYFPTLSNDGFYGEGELSKTIVKDENHADSSRLHTTEEFKDKQGRIVLKRTYGPFDVNDNRVIEINESELPFDTYYIYDDYGNLSYVLPPLMEPHATSLATILSEMNKLGYQYIYDNRNRLVQKRVPGKDWEYIVYNNLDQPIMTQDAKNRAIGEWLFTKYDAFGRMAYTGKAIELNGAVPKSRVEVQDTVNNSTGNLWVEQAEISTNFGNADVYYNNGAYPTTTLTEVLTISYYDNYVQMPTGAPSSVVLLSSLTDETNTTSVKGLPTVSRVKVLDNESTNWITSLTYYDKKARPIYSYSVNDLLGTTDIMESQLDFVGRTVKTKRTHIRNGNTIATIDNFTYDHVGRLIAQTQCIGDENLGNSCTGDGGNPPTADLAINDTTVTTPRIATNSITVTPTTTLSPEAYLHINATGTGGAQELIVLNEYDNLGRLAFKKVGDTVAIDVLQSNGLQQVTYKYNVLGWLKQINDPDNLGNSLFGFALKYNDIADTGKRLYNGNISQTHWGTQSPVTGSNDISNTYTYTYDALNRITGAVDNTTNYNVSGITYDKMGNILTLNRQGHTNGGATAFGTMDDLAYTYDGGNKLLKVSDTGNSTYGFKDGTNTGDDYGYDVNGNLILDRNKGITGIVYNHLNLPEQISINGSGNNGIISYIYDATGTKLRKITTDTGESSVTTTDYAGNYIYENGALRFFSQPEGYVEPNGSGGFDYVYQYRDHLGNVRLSYADADGDGQITVSSDPMLTEIVEESNYYPFGLEHKGYNNVSTSSNPALRWKFGGKELNEELGINWLDYGWRNYQPDLGRWMNIDNLAGMMKSQSPNSYALNNPIFYIDIDGLMPGSGPNHITDYYRAPDGTVYFDPNVNENTILPDGYTYIGPTYYDEASRTVWGPDGKPMRLNPIALDEVVVTGDKVKSREGSPTYWGVPGFGYEDRGRKGKREGELSHGDLPGFGSAKGGGNSWIRFLKWLNGVFSRGTTLQDVNVVTSPPGTSTMEQQPKTEPSVEGDTILRIYPDPILTTRTTNPVGASVRGYILKDTVIKNTEENVKKVNELSSKRINDYDK